jgi:hypothetical protein
MNSRKALDAPEFLIPKEAEPEYNDWLADFHRLHDGSELWAKVVPDRASAPLATQQVAPVVLGIEYCHGCGQAPCIKTRIGKVLNVLKDGLWHAGHELTGPAAGGSEGLRRLRELKERGYRIEARRIAGRASWEYKWIEAWAFKEER